MVCQHCHSAFERLQRETECYRQSLLEFTQILSTFGIMMCISSQSVSKDGGGAHETEAAAWLDTISFCNSFCQWVDEEGSLDSQPADWEQPVESTRASEAAEAGVESMQPLVEKSPTETPPRGNRRSRMKAFFKRAWKAIKKPFPCCRRTKVESPAPQEADEEPEPVPGPYVVQKVPGTNPAVLANCEPNTESMYSLYVLQDVLGKGSFGTVFRAIRKTDSRQVAVKRLWKHNNVRPTKIPGCSRPLPREVALMLMLRRPPVSPYVIQMYEWFDRTRVMSLVLEFPRPCMVLRKFISLSSGLIEPIARGLMRQLVLALQHCIDHSVFHNDIHADNILVNTRTMGLKLIDFGSAYLVDSAGYDSWRYLGAVEFCPPEAISAPKYYAVPTNVWSLGVVLYLMVNRQLPFSCAKETMEASPNSWKPTVSIACRDLIGRCLNRASDQRPTFKQILRHPWFKSRS